MKQYGLQQLIGDTIDGFKPTELCGVKFEEKSALKLLEPLQDRERSSEVVVKQYQKWYPTFEYTTWNGKKMESTEVYINHHHCCCRMKETKDDPLIAYDFYKRYG